MILGGRVFNNAQTANLRYLLGVDCSATIGVYYHTARSVICDVLLCV